MNLIQKQSEEPIDAWFCLGDLLLPGNRGGVQEEERYGVDQLLTGQITGIPTYLAIQDHIHGLSSGALLNSFQHPQRHTNCKILEPTGMIILPNGLRVAFISGIDPTETFPLPTNRAKVNKACLDHLRSTIRDTCKNVDILLTFEWPKFICQGDPKTPRSYLSFGSELLREFLTDIDARYIFAIGEGVSYEREPFLTPRGTLCRFSSLPRRDMSREDSIYQLRIGLEDGEAARVHGDPPSSFYFSVTLNRSDTERKRSGPTPDVPNIVEERMGPGQNTETQAPRPPRGYVCNICHIPGHHIRDCPDKTKRARSNSNHNSDGGDCWFCLANPTVRKHLIVDVGEHVYLALAHGPLTEDHILIIPIEHQPATLCPNGALADEIFQYQERLRHTYAISDTTPIFMCLQHDPAHHWHMASLSVRRERLNDLRSFVLQRSAQLNYPLEVAEPTNEHFFKIILPETTLSYTLKDPREFFPSQLGRQLMGEFLGVDPTRMDWKKCNMSLADEKRQVDSIRRRIFE